MYDAILSLPFAILLAFAVYYYILRKFLPDTNNIVYILLFSSTIATTYIYYYLLITLPSAISDGSVGVTFNKEIYYFYKTNQEGFLGFLISVLFLLTINFFLGYLIYFITTKIFGRDNNKWPRYNLLFASLPTIIAIIAGFIITLPLYFKGQAEVKLSTEDYAKRKSVDKMAADNNLAYKVINGYAKNNKIYFDAQVSNLPKVSTNITVWFVLKEPASCNILIYNGPYPESTAKEVTYEVPLNEVKNCIQKNTPQNVTGQLTGNLQILPRITDQEFIRKLSEYGYSKNEIGSNWVTTQYSIIDNTLFLSD